MCFYIQNYNSPIGNIIVKSDNNAVTNIYLGNAELENRNFITQKAVLELSEYFDGKRTQFTFPIKLHGTDFQKRVWNILREIPYGETYSYGKVAQYLGGKRYSRAVGSAVNKNPLLIVVPCHRVIGADGSLTGFACGLSVKKHLLNIEGGNYDL